MSERLFMARLFLMGGAFLAVIGLVLRFVVPIPSMFPPYLVTGLLAVGYGAACWWRSRSPGGGKS
jgi:hypothetical protein